MSNLLKAVDMEARYRLWTNSSPETFRLAMLHDKDMRKLFAIIYTDYRG
jgi:hypothetical protein